MNNQIEWFCYHAVDEHLVTATQCRLVARALALNSQTEPEIGDFVQSVIAKGFCTNVERLNKLATLAAKEAETLGPPPKSVLAVVDSTDTPLPPHKTQPIRPQQSAATSVQPPIHVLAPPPPPRVRSRVPDAPADSRSSPAAIDRAVCCSPLATEQAEPSGHTPTKSGTMVLVSDLDCRSKPRQSESGSVQALAVPGHRSSARTSPPTTGTETEVLCPHCFRVVPTSGLRLGQWVECPLCNGMVKVYREGFKASFAVPRPREVRCSGLGELRAVVEERAADGVLPDRIWRDSTREWSEATRFPFCTHAGAPPRRHGDNRPVPEVVHTPTMGEKVGSSLTLLVVVVILGVLRLAGLFSGGGSSSGSHSTGSSPAAVQEPASNGASSVAAKVKPGGWLTGLFTSEAEKRRIAEANTSKVAEIQYHDDAVEAFNAMIAIAHKIDAGISLLDLNSAITEAAPAVGGFIAKYGGTRGEHPLSVGIAGAWDDLLKARKHWTDAVDSVSSGDGIGELVKAKFEELRGTRFRAFGEKLGLTAIALKGLGRQLEDDSEGK